MENHPIPQDVTGFKFKLIGSMTVKQFLYLLLFGILTTVCFVLHVNILIKIPLMLFFAGIGASLAFVPIEGRPMDVMISNFVKTIPSENRYIFKKRGVVLTSYEVFRITVKPKGTIQTASGTIQKAPDAQKEADDKHAMLISRLRNSSFRPDADEIKQLSTIKSFFTEGTTPQQPGSPVRPTVLLEDQVVGEDKIQPKMAPQVIEADKPVTEELTPKPEQTAAPAPEPQPEPAKEDSKVEELKKQLEEAKMTQAAGDQDAATQIKELEEKLTQAENEKDTLAKKVIQYESSQNQTQEKTYTPGAAEAPEVSEAVKFVSPSASLDAGFPSLPDVPNVVMGKVCDPRNKTLPNVLVEIVDTNNVPVRAFKTNALGQFASATPLPNGTYKMYFEDPQKQHEFQIIEISLNGEIFNPIVVTSVDAREKLRRELFGGQQPQATA